MAAPSRGRGDVRWLFVCMSLCTIGYHRVHVGEGEMVVGLGPHSQPDGVDQAHPATPTPAPGATASPPVLRFTNVSKLFGSVKAVDDVSFDIHRGEFFTLLGPSGCGKTTSLRIVGGLEHPDDGEVALRGNLVAAPRAGIAVSPDRRNLGMVFQSYAIWPHM